MKKDLIKLLAIMAAAAVCALVTGCESEAESSAVIGGALGAGIGQLAGGDTESTLIGAAIGSGAGYAVGNESDKRKMRDEMNQIRAEQNIVTVWVTNSNGSRIPVRLTRQGPNYVGPRGEIYDHLPSSEELRPIYGF